MRLMFLTLYQSLSTPLQHLVPPSLVGTPPPDLFGPPEPALPARPACSCFPCCVHTASASCSAFPAFSIRSAPLPSPAFVDTAYSCPLPLARPGTLRPQPFPWLSLAVYLSTFPTGWVSPCCWRDPQATLNGRESTFKNLTSQRVNAPTHFSLQLSKGSSCNEPPTPTHSAHDFK